MAGHEIVWYANITHYIHVADSPDLRISDLIVKEPTRPGFTILTRFNPLSIGKSKQDSRIIDQKIDSSQNRYGHSINIDENGDIYFYVKYNYRQYFCKLINPIVISLFDANFQTVNFKSKNYKTESQIIVEEFIDDSYDLACEFIYSTKECIIKLLYNGNIIASASSLSGTTSLPPNLQVYLPLQEGNWSEVKTLPNNLPMGQVFDSSSNNLALTISNPTTTGIWNSDNTFTNNGNLAANNTYMTIPNGSYINVLTEMTWCFWIKRNDLVPDATYHYIITKGWAANGGFAIYKIGTSNSITVEIKNELGVIGTVTRSNAIPLLDKWYFVTVRWKSGEC